jgi:hypothetical protein
MGNAGAVEHGNKMRREGRRQDKKKRDEMNMIARLMR